MYTHTQTYAYKYRRLYISIGRLIWLFLGNAHYTRTLSLTAQITFLFSLNSWWLAMPLPPLLLTIYVMSDCIHQIIVKGKPVSVSVFVSVFVSL